MSRVGQQVANFTLKDFRGKQHSLDEFEQELVVIAFLGTECPLAKLYAGRLNQLSVAYADRGVAVIGINANTQDSNTELAAYARRHEIGFPLLKDLGNKVADDMTAVRTPEVFLLDADRKVRYWGRIDDQYGVTYVRDEPTRRDLQIAIDELLAGKPVSRPQIESVGCHIGRVFQPKKDAEVTYTNQISRILQRRCVECHREGEIAPFALTDYDEVVGWAETIAEVVQEQRMPPWHADPAHGAFLNDRHLSDEEKRLIDQWVKDGAPQGDLANLPEPIEYVEGWSLSREPDLVIPITGKPFKVPAEGTVQYQYFTVDPEFKEDKWLKAAELQPGNRAVVHHILVFARTSEGSLRAAGGGARGFLCGYVPGRRPVPFPQGMAKKIPAGSKLVFQVHYTPIGSVQEDLSKLGLIFATDDEEITHEVRTTSVVQPRLNIPPGEANYRTTAISRSPLKSDTLLLSLMPHMHLRGKAYKYEALQPGEKVNVLLDIPRYDFNWQTSYRLKEPMKLPKGTWIRGTAVFDNSEDNLNNPDPSKRVRWGDQTWNEMMIGYYDIAVPLDTPAERPVLDAISNSAKERAQRLMAEYDLNDDGRVDRDEAPQKAKAVFDRLDLDRSGHITQSELEKALSRIRR